MTHDWEVHHAVRACCPCGYQTELIRCGCDVSRQVSWDERKTDTHAGLAAAREAAQAHLDQTGHRLPVLEHRFVLECASDGTVQDFRAYPEAIEAGEAHAAA